MNLSSKIALMGVAALGIAAPALAQSASGVVNLVATNGTNNTYDLVVKNTGTVNLDSFWYAWIPYIGVLPDNYYNFLPHDPSGETSPTGWTPTVVGPGIFGDGYSIRWDASSNPLTPGSTDTFGFTTQDSFATLNGPDTIAFVNVPVGTSYVYTGAAEGSAAGVFTVEAGSQTIPEPATIALVTLGAGALCSRRPRRKA